MSDSVSSKFGVATFSISGIADHVDELVVNDETPCLFIVTFKHCGAQAHPGRFRKKSCFPVTVNSTHDVGNGTSTVTRTTVFITAQRSPSRRSVANKIVSFLDN